MVAWTRRSQFTDTCATDVNLLAAPALHQSGIDHCVAVVCGTGTIGRTIRIRGKGEELPPSPPGDGREAEIDNAASKENALDQGLPLEDVGVARGWGYM